MRLIEKLAALSREDAPRPPVENPPVLKKGTAMRVIFFYPGEEGTYVDNAEVVLYQNGIVHITSNQEETTTHLQNCEILWNFETEAEERVSKVRLLKPQSKSKAESKSGEASPENSAGGSEMDPTPSKPTQPTK